MGTDIMNLDRMFSEIKVPSKPHIANEQQPVTHEELENRMRIAKELESIGISTSKCYAGYYFSQSGKKGSGRFTKKAVEKNRKDAQKYFEGKQKLKKL